MYFTTTWQVSLLHALYEAKMDEHGISVKALHFRRCFREEETGVTCTRRRFFKSLAFRALAFFISRPARQAGRIIERSDCAVKIKQPQMLRCYLLRPDGILTESTNP